VYCAEKRRETSGYQDAPGHSHDPFLNPVERRTTAVRITPTLHPWPDVLLRLLPIVVRAARMAAAISGYGAGSRAVEELEALLDDRQAQPRWS
jgi:hypothetical protein